MGAASGCGLLGSSQRCGCVCTCGRELEAPEIRGQAEGEEGENRTLSRNSGWRKATSTIVDNKGGRTASHGGGRRGPCHRQLPSIMYASSVVTLTSDDTHHRMSCVWTNGDNRGRGRDRDK